MSRLLASKSFVNRKKANREGTATGYRLLLPISRGYQRLPDSVIGDRGCIDGLLDIERRGMLEV